LTTAVKANAVPGLSSQTHRQMRGTGRHSGASACACLHADRWPVCDGLS